MIYNPAYTCKFQLKTTKETIGTLLEIPLRVLTNEECYKDFLKESNQINSQVRNTLYDGITDQILCSKLTCNENDFTGTSEKKWIKCVSQNRSHCIEVAQGDIFMF